MNLRTWQRSVYTLAIIASAAFAVGNLLIGLSIGTGWLRMDPLVWMDGFWAQFTGFALSIIPLFLLTLLGLALAARIDWGEPRVRRLWFIAIGLYVVTSLITLFYHLPENFRLRAATYSAAEADAVRSLWLGLHVPRIILAFSIPVVALRAVFERLGPPPR